MEELLKRLTETPGPAGQEQQVRDAIAKEILPFCQELREDPLGNLLARIGTNQDYRVGILAHMDEVGLIVSQISDRGLISFEVGGTVDARQLPGLEVDLMASDGKLIRGVIGNQSRHLQTAEELGSQISHRQLFIDIGARSREEVLAQRVSIGSGVVFATKFHPLSNRTILGKALDDRVACAVLVKTIQALHSALKNITVYGMFTIQEEIGAKGARVVAFDAQPQMIIALDTVPTKNPDLVRSQEVELGRGPVIRLFDWHPSTKLGMFTHRAIRDRLLQVAKDEGVAHQVDVLTSTYLDSSQAHLTAGGIPGGSICFPRRYAHGPVELSHLNDIEGGLKLLIAFMKSVDDNPIRFGKLY